METKTELLYLLKTKTNEIFMKTKTRKIKT